MNTSSVLDRFLDPFTDCLTSEVAERIVNLQLDSQTQSRLDELAAKANEGQLTDDEREEYEEFVEGIDLMGILKARARTVLMKRAIDGRCYSSPRTPTSGKLLRVLSIATKRR